MQGGKCCSIVGAPNIMIFRYVYNRYFKEGEINFIAAGSNVIQGTICASTVLRKITLRFNHLEWLDKHWSK
jgi:hypothetical protein